MTGTLVNSAAVIAGSLLGLCLKKGIKKEMTDSINLALGLAVCIIGLNGIICNMFKAENGVLSSSGELLLVIFLVTGTVIGEALHIDERLNGIGGKIEARFKMQNFSLGFVNASLIFCVGAMSIIGSLNDGIMHDSTVLLVKSALDFTAAIVLSASMGIGVLFSFIPVFLYQGGITLASGALSGILQGDLLIQICTVGYAVILTIGINFIFPKKFKTANLLPCLLMPCIYQFVMWLYGLVRTAICK